MISNIISDPDYIMWVESDEFTAVGTNHVRAVITEFGLQTKVTFITARLNLYDIGLKAIEMPAFSRFDKEDLCAFHQLLEKNKENLMGRYFAF